MVEAADDIEELRARLLEAEDTLRAIRQGDVDALLVEGPGGEQVYALKSADLPYRIMMERMREGALTLGADGSILYANRSLADMLGAPLERVLGRSFLDLVEPLARRALATGLGEGGEIKREVTIVRAEAPPLRALLSLSPLALDGVQAHSGILADLSEQKRGEELAAAAGFAQAVVDQANEAMVVCDRQGRVVQASRAAREIAGGEPTELPLWDAFDVQMASRQDGDPGDIRAAVLQALAGRTLQGLEATTHVGEERRFFQLSAGPLWDGRREAIGCIVTLTDITQRKRAEEHQGVLLAELSHRVKNTLAIVRAIAERTAASTADNVAFNAAFQGRLTALALAHDVLTRVAWGQVDLRELLSGSLSAASGREAELSGPEVTVPPQAVLPLALIFHELATNALKYGALAGGGGRLTVRWSLLERDQLAVEWREATPRGVAPPARKGFGSQLIARMASFDLDGEVSLDYRSEGLHCRLRVPLRPNEAALIREAVRSG